jgi:uncharacterized cupredoxin-like copper-binding protein
MRQLSSRLGRLLVVVLSMIVAAGCSASGRVAGPRGTVVRVNARDFQLTITPKHIQAGNVRLVVRNHGPDTHEVIVVRPRSQISLRRDGLTVDEEALSAVTVASVEGTGPGRVEQVRVHLAPGRYELFCNMAGHFMAGMHGELVVD